MPTTTNCVQCEKEIRISRKGLCSSCYQKKRYAEKRDSAIPNNTCAHCGKAFWSNKKTTKCCSLKCSAMLRGGPIDFDVDESNRVTLHCEYCGDSFKVYPYEAKKGRRFCSLQCSGERRITRPRNTGTMQSHWRQKTGFRLFARAWIDENPKCNRCSENNRRKLVLHHPKEPGFNLALLFHPDNLEVLCRGCHATHHKPSA